MRHKHLCIIGTLDRPKSTRKTSPAMQAHGSDNDLHYLISVVMVTVVKVLSNRVLTEWEREVVSQRMKTICKRGKRFYG